MRNGILDYHRVLNRAVWSSLAVSAVLLILLVNTFAHRGPVAVGLDESLEGRCGEKIKAKGIYRESKSPLTRPYGITLGNRPFPFAGS